mmetsp:Transcript_57345/g.119916  ORF Transcript_57345/g.119916 Transcript_57345/m.119916 type:complete len:200 (+) Transcript_57345:2366-2965(+)
MLQTVRAGRPAAREAAQDLPALPLLRGHQPAQGDGVRRGEPGAHDFQQHMRGHDHLRHRGRPRLPPHRDPRGDQGVELHQLPPHILLGGRDDAPRDHHGHHAPRHQPPRNGPADAVHVRGDDGDPLRGRRLLPDGPVLRRGRKRHPRQPRPPRHRQLRPVPGPRGPARCRRRGAREPDIRAGHGGGPHDPVAHHVPPAR